MGDQVLMPARVASDGGNRDPACLESGVTPRFVDYSGENFAACVLL